MQSHVPVLSQWHRRFVETKKPADADGAVDAHNASTSSLENAENAFPTAPTGITFLASILASVGIVHGVPRDP